MNGLLRFRVFRRLSARHVAALFWIISVFLTIAQCVAYYHRSSRERFDQQQDQVEAYATKVRALASAMKELESSALVTATSGLDPDEMESYREVADRIPGLLRPVRDIVSEPKFDAEARGGIEVLARQVDAAVVAVDRALRSAATRPSSGRAIPTGFRRVDPEHVATESVLHTADGLEAHADAALARLGDAERKSVQNNSAVFAAITTIDVFVLAAAFLAMNRFAAYRRRVEASLHAAREAAEASDRAKDRLLATVSHDLRNPLNGIRLWAQLARDSSGDAATLDEALNAIASAVDTQSRLVDDLLDSARISHGSFRVDLVPMDLRVAVEAGCRAILPVAVTRHVALHPPADTEATPILIHGDAIRLQQVVWNLLHNAVKFTPEGGRIDVTVERRDDRSAVVVVRDTGRGIPRGAIPRLFNAFTQADPKADRTTGLGLGLSIVKNIVELHRGTITVDSAGPGLGTTFTVKLPTIDAGSAADEPHYSRVAMPSAVISNIRSDT